MRRIVGASSWLLALMVVLVPARAGAAPREFLDDPEPWGRGLMVPSLGIGMSFGPSIHVLDFGLGFSYFVVDGLAVGLGVSDTVYIYRKDFKEDFPGIEDETPTNVVRVIPDLRYVFLRRRVFSPYVHAGVGPVFYNRGRGTVGEWVAGVGAYIGLAPHFALSLGVDFGANFPDNEWKEAFSYMGRSIRGCALTDSPCSFNVFPRIGLVAFFGGGGRRGESSRGRAPSGTTVSPAPTSPPPSGDAPAP